MSDSENSLEKFSDFEESPSEYYPSSNDGEQNRPGPSRRRRPRARARVSEISQQASESSSDSNERSQPLRLEAGRKRTRNPKKWKRNIRKYNRASGKPYVNTKNRLVPSRKTGADCSCHWKCFEKVDDDLKRKILSSFNELADKTLQDCHIAGLIAVRQIQRKRVKSGDGVPRSKTYTYKVII